MVENRSRARRRSTTFPESFTPRVPGMNYGILDRLVGYAIRRAQIAIYADFFRAVGDEAITPQRLATLVIIAANPGLQQNQLAEVLGVARPGATAVIDFWQGRGAVARHASPNDRRSNGICLTPKGEALLNDLQAIVQAHDKAVTRDLSQEEIDILMRLLGKIAATRHA